MEITNIHLSHPQGGLGYRFEEDGKSFVFLTDNELHFDHPDARSFDDYVRFSEGADVLFHDAEYTEDDYKISKGWGHSLYTDALDLALKAGVGEFGLFHHNMDRHDDDVDAIVDDCARIISEAGSPMKCYGAAQGMEIRL